MDAAPVGLGLEDRVESRRVHLLLDEQSLGDGGVALRPSAAGAPRGEASSERVVVADFDPSVDPAEAQSLFECLGVTERRGGDDPLLGEHHHDAARRGVVVDQPLAPVPGVGHQEFGEFHRLNLTVAMDPHERLTEPGRTDDQSRSSKSDEVGGRGGT